jgi:CRP/FNR family transcriptional regulator, anaerobic regulatory protein
MTNKLSETFQNLGLSNEQTAKLSNVFKHTLELKKGDFFYQNTQICHKIGFMEEGMLRYYYDTEKSDVTRWVALGGEFVTSLGSFITQMQVKENIQAIQNTKIIYASREDWKILYQNEEFVRELWTSVIEENYIGMENRLFNMIALSAEARYEWILKNYPKFNLYIPDKYLASMLGITPRHLSRIRGMRK